MHFGYSEQYANLTFMSVLVVMKCRVRTRVTLISGKSSSNVVKGLCSGMHSLTMTLKACVGGRVHAGIFKILLTPRHASANLLHQLLSF